MFREVIKSKSKTFLAFCFCFLLGIALGSVRKWGIDLVWMYTSVFVFITLLVTTWQDKKRRWLVFALLFFFLGFTRSILVFPTAEIVEEKTTITGYVAAEPDVRLGGVRYIVDTEGMNGHIYVKSTLYPRYAYGDLLAIDCTLRKPEPIEEFRYDMYLARFGVFAMCNNPNIEKVAEEEGSGLMRGILQVKNSVASRINKLWPEPHASFMAGLLYGYRGGLGNLNEQFARTGVTHIVAISGYNITIISQILIALCISLLIPRKKAFWFVVIGIILFIIFAGMSASVVRAGIMGIVVLIARQMGRTSQVANMLALTAVFMSLHNPLVLLWDAGFQLSFLATLGLVYIAPLLEPFLQKVPTFLGVRESISATVSATVATLPLILSQFGQLSLVSIPVNVLILWLIPFIMLLGFLAVLFSYLFFPIGTVIAWLAFVAMIYITTIVRWFSALPFAAVNISLPLIIVILLYGIIGWKIYRYSS